MKPFNLLCSLLLLAWPMLADAHHSFSIYQIENRIELKGTLRELQFRSPHITMQLEVVGKDGSHAIREIESLNLRRWDDGGHPRNFAAAGEEITVLGWPARNGSKALLLGTVITARDRHVLIEEVHQHSARQAALR